MDSELKSLITSYDLDPDTAERVSEIMEEYNVEPEIAIEMDEEM